MDKVVVTAPYVMLKVKDPATGGVTVRDFYRDAILPDGADPEAVQRLTGKGMLEVRRFADPEPPEPVKEPEKPAEDKAEPKKATPAKKTGNG